MIEGSNAFKQLADGKSWDQLGTRVQQQIRLAAILEQTYARYGNTLQQNTLTKQERLTEVLKDTKLHISQAFLPIYDVVLPPLIWLGEKLSWVTEQLARFIHGLFNWDYDEMTRGSNKQTDAIGGQAGAYDDLAQSAKKARGEIAGFDELNLIGRPDSKGGSRGGGGPGTPLPEVPKPKEPGPSFWDNFSWPDWPPWPPLPQLPTIGAVATALLASINTLNAEIKTRIGQLWTDIKTAFKEEVDKVKEWWSGLWVDLLAELAENNPLIIAGLGLWLETVEKFEEKLNNLKQWWVDTLDAIKQKWDEFWDPVAEAWAAFRLAIEGLENPLTSLKMWWKDTLSGMQNNLNDYRPYIEWGWKLVALAINKVKDVLESLRKLWLDALGDMEATANLKLGPIAASIAAITAAWEALRDALSKGLPNPEDKKEQKPATNPASAANPASITDKLLFPALSTDAYRFLVPNLTPTAATVPAATANKPLSYGEFAQQSLTGLVDSFNAYPSMVSAEQFAVIGDYIRTESAKPTNQAAFAVLTALYPAGRLAGVLAKYGGSAINAVKNILPKIKGIGSAIPAFASGGMVYGPTLAFVGDNPGAATDPEVIAPVSDLQDMLSGSNAEVVAVLLTMLKVLERIAAKDPSIKIGESEFGRLVGRALEQYTQQGGVRLA